MPLGLSDVKTIYSTGRAFAALKENGTVEAWGGWGGSGVPSGLRGVKAIYSVGGGAFAALKEDGTVAVWGGSTGTNGHSDVPDGLSGVKTIYSTDNAFAALKDDGTVEAWGDSDYGGSGVPSGLSGVKAIYSTGGAFAALKEDGTVEAWGDSDRGGSGVPDGLSGVKAIYSTGSAFAALKEDGTVEVWGDSHRGGRTPSTLAKVSTIFGYTGFYSDSTSMHHYPCPDRYYGSGIPDCSACPSDVPDSKKNNFSLGIRSVIGSCILCDQPTFSEDGKTCADACAEGYTRITLQRFMTALFRLSHVSRCR